jgi:DnaJ family protein C protein 2
MFTVSAPSSSSKTRVCTQINNLIGECNNALPIGSEALLRLGGKISTTDQGVDENAFDESRLVIPVGVTPQNLKNFTFYDMLGFGTDLGDIADVDIIKKAYHKAVLMYHPDKAQFKTPDGKEDRSVFLKIQEAFNVLSSEPKRRAYDSQLPFDESIPKEAYVKGKMEASGNKKFFIIFGKCFTRNARFAVKKPVPELGDMETPTVTVNKFYNYWVNFESWRDFTGVGAEYKPDDAGSREEKRYMQKENEKLAVKLKKKEVQRIIDLVTLAQKLDPRVVAAAEAKKEAKEAEKNAREYESKKKIEEEIAMKAWVEAEELAAKEAKSASKEVKDKLKKAQSKARNIFKKLLRISAAQGHGSGEYGCVSVPDVELLCAHCNLEDLNTMNTAFGGEAATKEGVSDQFTYSGFEDVCLKLEYVHDLATQAQDDARIAKEIKKRESDEKSNPTNRTKVVREWTRDILSTISKSSSRYPAGTTNRWDLITNYVNDVCKPVVLFTQDEIVRAAFNAKNNGASSMSTK